VGLAITRRFPFDRNSEKDPGMCQGCVGNIFGSLGGLRLGLSRRQFFATAAGATAIAPMVPAPAVSGDGADLIFHGGPVIPLAGFGQYAEALAVKNGNIIAVGTSDAIMGLKSNSTQLIDLGGRALLPGFIDPHQHTVTGALINAIFTDCGYTKYRTRAALLAMFRGKADKTPPGQWLLFTSFDNLLQGGDLMMPDLDAISKVHPILLYYINMHTAAGNSAAFAAAKIPDDIGSLPGGGRFGRDASGKLDGMIYENQR
jgi:predicted amidohydrolase YtcJ